MIFPRGHDELRSRGVPWLTIVLAALAFLVHPFLARHEDAARARYRAAGDAAAAFWARHAASTDPPPALEEYFARTYDARLRFGSRRTMAHGLSNPFSNELHWFEGTDAPTAARVLDPAFVQSEVRRLSDPLPGLARDLFLLRWGNVPAWGGAPSLITSIFLHGGWIHLLGCLWFLALVAPTIEAEWGAAALAVLFVASGLGSAVGARIGAAGAATPFVGMTGAIAGLLGAFLVKHAQARLRFGWFALKRVATFEPPALVALPLWLVWDVGLSLMLPEERGRVSISADLAALALGAAAAVAVRRWNLEPRFAPATVATPEEIVAAAPEPAPAAAPVTPAAAPPAAPRAPRPASKAIREIERRVRARPNDPEPLHALAEAAKAEGDRERERQARITLMWLDLRAGNAPAALAAWDELVAAGLDAEAPDPLRIELARALEQAGDLDGAEAGYAAIHRGTRRDPPAIQAILAHAALVLARDRDADAARLLDDAEGAHWLHADVRARIDRGRRELARRRVTAQIAKEDALAARRAAESVGAGPAVAAPAAVGLAVAAPAEAAAAGPAVTAPAHEPEG